MLLLRLRSCKKRGTLDKVTVPLSPRGAKKELVKELARTGFPENSRRNQGRESFLPSHLSSQLPLCLHFRTRSAVLGSEPLEGSEAKFTSGNLS